MDADATAPRRPERHRVDPTVGLVIAGLILSVIGWLLPLNTASLLVTIGAVAFALTAVIYELVLWSRIKREALLRALTWPHEVPARRTNQDRS